MIAAFLLGLLGSLGHCVGMCTGVLLLLAGRRTPPWAAWLALHLGRISSYALLGALTGLLSAGLTGSAMAHNHDYITPRPAWLQFAQGSLALGMAALAGYMALALLGHVPSPEVALAGITSRWRRCMQRLSGRLRQHPGHLARYAAGVLWGLLPCGLVLSALLVAASTRSPLQGALSMLAFGLGTLPALLSSGWLASRATTSTSVAATGSTCARLAAAAVVLLFGAQTALRGLAAWGLVGHLVVGGGMVW